MPLCLNSTPMMLTSTLSWPFARALASTLVVQLVVMIVDLSVAQTSGPVIAHVVGRLITSLALSFALVTSTFILLEHYGPGRNALSGHGR